MSISEEAAAPRVDGTRARVFSFVFIDVDGKDQSLGLSAPPESFITPETLSAIHSLLSPGGILAINVVARGGEGPINDLVAKVKCAFGLLPMNLEDTTELADISCAQGGVYVIRPSDEDVNVILIAQKRNISVSGVESELDEGFPVDDTTTLVSANGTTAGSDIAPSVTTAKTTGSKKARKKKGAYKNLSAESKEHLQKLNEFLRSAGHPDVLQDPLNLRQYVAKIKKV